MGKAIELLDRFLLNEDFLDGKILDKDASKELTARVGAKSRGELISILKDIDKKLGSAKVRKIGFLYSFPFSEQEIDLAFADYLDELASRAANKDLKKWVSKNKDKVGVTSKPWLRMTAGPVEKPKRPQKGVSKMSRASDLIDVGPTISKSDLSKIKDRIKKLRNALKDLDKVIPDELLDAADIESFSSQPTAFILDEFEEFLSREVEVN